MSFTVLGRKVDSALIGGAQAVASAIVLASVYAFEHFGGLQSCPLCLYQRWPWWIALAIGLIVVFARGRPVFAMGAAALSSTVILAGAGISGFHIGVEQHWWEGLASCGGTGEMLTTVEALKRQIMSAPVVRCDEVAWSLFGVSMAGYNFLTSFVLGVGSLFALYRIRKVYDGR